ncbi:hexosaminidase D-like isoform X2 [Daphnia pulicaria]|nr:hexosaminidase D-like isoform X2 [Daphnia pulicaria]
MARLIRNLFSLRQCKCLFVSVLLVCAVMVLVALKLHPDLVKAPFYHDVSSNALTSRGKSETPSSKETGDLQSSNGDSDWTDSVQFLPHTESSVISTDGGQPVKNYQAFATQNLESIINSGPIYYHQKVPNYIPDSPVARGDISAVETQGFVRPVGQLLPSNVYLSQDSASVTQKDNPVFVPDRRLVHFDLKGAPPKIDYLQQLIPLIVQLGGTGLLIEYEDMFPYEGDLKSISASNHYTRAEIRSLLNVAEAYKLEVIPLVQTFGHLEYALKLPQFSHLRENPAVPQAVCPSQNESFVLIQNLVDQIMSMHEGIKYLHIGCDEVFHMAECAICSLKPKDDLFLSHVHRVASYVNNKYKVKPIIWDDMLRHMTAATLDDAKLGDIVEPMVWVYAEDVYRFAGSYVFDRYAQVFPSFWISSSFKGAFGETLIVPDISRHLENNLNWLDVGRTESPKFRQGLRGIAITGWQRYDHFSNLCELLPASIPSLAVNLLTTSRGYYNQSLAPSLYKALSCQKAPRYEKIPDLRISRSDRFLHEKMTMCFFPGAPFFKSTARILRLEKEIEEYVILTTKRKGWLTDYSVRHNYSSPARIDELLRDLPYLSGSLNAVAKQTMDILKNIFDVHTISEWMEQKLLPLFEKLDRIQMDAATLRSQKYWPVRPLKLFDRWQQYGLHFNHFFNVNETQSSTHH